MAFERKPNTFALFKNKRKQSESHADRDGSILFECPHCKAQTDAYLNGWDKQDREGELMITGSVKIKTVKPIQAEPAENYQPRPDRAPQQRDMGYQQSMPGSRPPPSKRPVEPDDEIPF